MIIGAGPAGLFAALKAIQSGIKPIIYERGKNVQERRRDIAALNKKSLVNPESNYCFGEGVLVLIPMGNFILDQRKEAM